MTRKCIGMVLLGSVLAGCATMQPTPYQQADPGLLEGRQGYLDERTAPGRYIVEYADIGGPGFSVDRNREYWHRRAAELCPAGFEGEPETIPPGDARIAAFRCTQRFCREYPVVSGVITCTDHES